MKRLTALFCLISLLLILNLSTAFANDSLNVSHIETIINGWYTVEDIEVNDTHAFITANQTGLHILDITDTENIFSVAALPISGSYKIDIHGNYVFVTCYWQGNHQITIIDISNPEEPLITSVINIGNYSMLNVCITNTDLFVIRFDYGHETYTSELLVYDLSNPSSPFLYNQIEYDGRMQSFAFNDDKLFIPYCTDNGLLFLKILDVSAPVSISILSNSRVYAPATYFNRMRLLVEDSLLYLSADDDLVILDVSDPTSPAHLGSLTVQYDVCEIAKVGDFILSVNNLQRRVIDVSNPSNPTVEIFTEPPVLYSKFALKGNKMFGLYGPRVMSDPRTYNLKVLDISDLRNITEIADFDYHSTIHFLTKVEDYLLLTDAEDGTSFLDISDPFDMQYIGRNDSIQGELFVHNNLLVNKDGYRLMFYDIADDILEPTLLYSVEDEYVCEQFYFTGNYMIGLSDYFWHKVFVFDISNPADGPSLVCEFDGDSENSGHQFFPEGLTIYNDLIYIIGYFGSSENDGSLDFMIVELGDDGELSEVSRFDLLDHMNPKMIFASNGYLHLIDNVLYTFSLGDPYNPTPLSSFETGGYISNACLVDDVFYLSDNEGLLVVDVTNPMNPCETGHYYKYGIYSNNIAFHEGVAYLSGLSSVRSYDVSEVTSVEDGSTSEVLPSCFAITQAYPNPFNPTLNVSIALPEFSELQVKVVNVLGQEVATLTNRFHSAGTHNFIFDGSELSSGIYFIKASVPNRMDQVQKVILMK